ncbi:cathelicidin antimicrobial peptide-like [Ascaphus truei]|uniref:cathelicidin antimicrobial peptide-like n=1 Tax=Ascaphus truei TaxID=8439 RepID=UPI003F593526
MMKNCVRVMLIFNVAALIRCAPIKQGVQSIRDRGNTVERATAYLNNELDENFIFKLRNIEKDYQPGYSERPHQLKFTIQETACVKLENHSIEDCTFKPDGVVKSCIIFIEHGTDSLIVRCNTETDKARKYHEKEGEIKRDVSVKEVDTGKNQDQLQPQCFGCIFSLLPGKK